MKEEFDQHLKKITESLGMPKEIILTAKKLSVAMNSAMSAITPKVVESCDIITKATAQFSRVIANSMDKALNKPTIVQELTEHQQVILADLFAFLDQRLGVEFEGNQVKVNGRPVYSIAFEHATIKIAHCWFHRDIKVCLADPRYREKVAEFFESVEENSDP